MRNCFGCVSFQLKVEEVAFSNATGAAFEDACSSNSSETHLDTQKRKKHYAAYPEDLCKIPILATCPSDGIVLDPFCGTGTTSWVARTLGRKSIGIDISEEYLMMAESRCMRLL